MELYCAIDLHSTNNVPVVINNDDKCLFSKRLPNDLDVITRELSPFREDITAVAVESTYNGYWLLDGLAEAGYEVMLVNTSQVPQYSGLKYSDDEKDAFLLARLMRLGLLPVGYIYPKEERGLRDLLRKRAQMVRIRTQQILSIQTQYARHTGLTVSGNEVKHCDQYLLGQNDDINIDIALRSNQAVLRCVTEQIDMLEKEALKQCHLRPEFEALQSIDGVGKILALTIMLEVGDINRFKAVGNFASYCRCVGSKRMSNGKKKGKGNVKNGNKYLAWAFIEAANFAKRYNPQALRFYQRRLAKTNNMIATKTLAHKLARATYYILRDQVIFDNDKLFS